jgi:transcription elongation factor GreA
MADGPVRWGESVRSRAAGVFVVELPVPLSVAPIDTLALRRWIERVPTLRLDGRVPTPTELSARLAGFWLSDQTVLYVGRTAKSLAGRVAALYATPLGDSRPHSGGHWLKTLRDIERSRVWWAETDAPEEYEDALLSAFAERVTADEAPRLHDRTVLLPFANRETATGERKVHGITGSLLTADAVRPAATPTAASTPGAVPPPARPRATKPRAPTTRRVGARRTAETSRPAPAATHLSASGLAKLSAELDELRTIRRPQVIARVKAARELGDLRENADYEAARNEQSFLEGRIQTLERMLVSAVVIDDEAGRSSDVVLGSTVVLERDGEHEEYTLVGSTEASPTEGRISGSSPVGRALLGRSVGDQVRVPLPRGEVTYRIIEVR